MRGLLFSAVAALPLLTGCNLTKLVSYNLVNEPITLLDQAHVNQKAIRLAKDAWLDHLTCIPDNCPPAPYEWGFLHGYSDYLLMGGNCSPPAMPPANLRRHRNMDAEGQLEIRAYYTGFHYGSQAARASGQRSLFIIPLSAPLPREDTPNYDVGRTVEKTFPEETLPTPQKIDPNKIDPPLSKPEVPELKLPRELPGLQDKPKLSRHPAVAPSAAPSIQPVRAVLAPEPAVGSRLPREFMLQNLGGAGAR